MREFDYVIIGGGCAGLSLAYELDLNQKLSNKTLAIIEPRKEYLRDKTWSFWKVSPHNFEDCVKKSWHNFSIKTSTSSKVIKCDNFPYQSIDSGLFYKKINPLKAGDEVLVPSISWSTTYFPLQQYGLKLKFIDVDPKTLNIDIKSVKKNISKKTKLICLADDSCLEIDILNKDPGIYSARWGGKKNDFTKAIKRVYRELFKKDKQWKQKKIKARFICALSISYLNKKIACVYGKIEGHISNEPKGKNGFGYDPIFIPQGKKLTFGQMKPSLKYKIDHRAKAFKKIKKFF